MKTQQLITGLSVLATLATARPMYSRREILRREVPQEHSHEQFLTTVGTSLATNNPDNIQDPVFGLLGNAAAIAGAGSITDPECLQQATADQAFTNAKAASDVAGMTAALIYRALERNTGKVGLASNSCTTVTAANPEIAAISQHQDPASSGAAATNKAIVLALAQQISAVGGNPQDALKSGTFAPGDVTDPTGAGNTCDDANDATGCIFTQNLLVEDATADEIDAAVSGGTGAAATTGATAAAGNASTVDTAAASSCNGTATGGDTAAAASGAAAATPATGTTAATAASGTVAASSSNLDFGSCSNPTIVFGAGFDGRTEDSFEPANEADFNHGSALNIGVIASFICGQLGSKCAASAAAVSACDAGQTAAAAATGQAAADAFNAALGF